MSLRHLGIEISRRRKKEKTFLEDVRSFYMREDNSVIVAGIKRTKTLKKEKKRRRILKDTLKNLHAKKNCSKLSYSSFCRLKPFWIVSPVESDRDTCLCKLCQNTVLLHKEVRKYSDVEKSLEEMIKNRVCNSTQRNCMYGECPSCSGKFSRFIELASHEKSHVIWQQWQRKTDKRIICTGNESKEKQVSFTVKQNVSGNVGEISSFEEECSKYTKHIYNCRALFRYFRKRRESLQLN